jgi:hypothetical protein
VLRHLAPSRYEAGAPPPQGVCTIAEDGDRLPFHARWSGHKRAQHEVQFAGVPDGERYPLEGQDAGTLHLPAG